MIFRFRLRAGLLPLVMIMTGGCDSSGTTPDHSQSKAAEIDASGAKEIAATPAREPVRTPPEPEASPPAVQYPSLNSSIGRAYQVYRPLLEEVVTAEGLVRYDLMQQDLPTQQISYVVRELGNASIPTKPGELLAFYCNAYNANVLFQAMMERSRNDIESVLDVPGFFKKRPITVAGEPMTLDYLEQDRIRPLKDPRIHAALVCAAQSCPPLSRTLFLADTIDAQLDEQCRRWVNDPSKNRVDGETLQLSEIFNWYGEDFNVEPYGGVIGFLRHFAAPDSELATFLQSHPDPKIEWMKYDWSLNQARTP